MCLCVLCVADCAVLYELVMWLCVCVFACVGFMCLCGLFVSYCVMLYGFGVFLSVCVCVLVCHVLLFVNVLVCLVCDL